MRRRLWLDLKIGIDIDWRSHLVVVILSPCIYSFPGLLITLTVSARFHYSIWPFADREKKKYPQFKDILIPIEL